LAFRLMKNKRALERTGSSIHSIEAPIFSLVNGVSGGSVESGASCGSYGWSKERGPRNQVP
jgi:hypothetical protein